MRTTRFGRRGTKQGMKRALVLGAVLAFGVVSLTVTTAGQGEMVVEVERIKDNLYVLRGGGGNSAAFVTSDGVVLVDTKLEGWGQPLIDRIAELTSNPVTVLVNTHTHFDHVSGNVEFPASVDVVAHENAARLMEEWNPVTGFPGSFTNVFELSGGQGLPTHTFSDRMTLGRGDDRVDLHYFGRGHTGRRHLGRVPGARRHARRRHVPRPAVADPRREQRRERRRLPADAAQRARRRAGRGHDHHRPQRADDPRRPRTDGGLRRGFRRRGAGRQGGRAVGGRGCGGPGRRRRGSTASTPRPRSG